MVITPMSAAEVEEFLTAQAAALQLESVADSRHSTGGQEMRILGYKGESRTLNTTIIRDESGETTVQFLYEEESAR